MRSLFFDYRKYAYALILTLAISSVFFASRPTGMVTSASSSYLAERAFSSEAVRDFALRAGDFTVITEELTPEKLAALRQAQPQMYTNLPDAVLYQMILDAGEKALIIILNEDAVFRTWEVQYLRK